MKHRRGVSLIEMIVVIGASAMVLAAGIGMLHTLMRSERKAAESLIHANSHARLSAQFRDDVHATKTATVQGEPGSDHALQLSGTDAAEISYTQRDRLLIRSETQSSQPPRYEQFRLPGDVQVRFTVSDAGGQQVVDLTWGWAEGDSTTNASRAARRHLNPLQVEAVVGRDHRFQEAAP